MKIDDLHQDADADAHDGVEEELEDEQDGPLCPICRFSQYDCGDGHLVLALDNQDGPLSGALYDTWPDLLDEVRDAVFNALVAGSTLTSHSDTADAVLQSVREMGWRWQEHVPEPEDVDEDVDPEHAREEFEDQWLGFRPEAAVLLAAALAETPGVLTNAFEVSTAPGLSWCGDNYFAQDPSAAVDAFLERLYRRSSR